MRSNFLIDIHNCIDGFLKFPNLKKGDTGIQIGFDLSSKNLTSDLWIMSKRVGKTGHVIGIDPDPFNHSAIKPILEREGVKFTLVQKGTYNEKTKSKLIIAKRSSWNKLDVVDSEDSPNFTDKKIEVSLDTLDNILDDLKCDKNRISHVNITNNGAEYDTLKGMTKLLQNNEGLTITVIAGRQGKMGVIDGKPDYEIISDFLSSNGFKIKFYRMSQLFWWGFVHQLLLKRKWVFGKTPYGVIIATKGKNKRKWYQSYS
jgi:FkbM family methyltransferase